MQPELDSSLLYNNKLYNYFASSMLNELSWPSIKDIIRKEINIMTVKAVEHDPGPVYLNTQF